MYCICRRRPSCVATRLAKAMASLRRSGSSNPASCSGVRATKASPSACSASMSFLRRVLLTGLSSSAGWRRVTVGRGCLRSSCYDNSPFPREPPMSDTRFAFTPDRFKEIAADVLAKALTRGATAAETEVSESIGQSVTVRQSEVETIEYTRDKGLSLTVYIGHQRGHASTTDLSAQALSDTVDKALTIARFTAADECAGLADEDLLAREFPALDLYRPWGISVERAIELAKACEAAAFAVDRRIS